MKKSNVMLLLAAITTMALTACSEKKKSEDIIAQRVVKTAPREPVRLQDYSDDRDVDWIGKTYHVAIHRWATDSLPMIADENGQKYVDNLITVAVSRKDGSLFFRRTFRKTDFSDYLDDDYARNGILEGLVFDKADGDWLVFAASVSHPQADDEYIPLVMRLSRMGKIEIRRDTQMDTNAGPSPSQPQAAGDDGV